MSPLAAIQFSNTPELRAARPPEEAVPVRPIPAAELEGVGAGHAVAAPSASFSALLGGLLGEVTAKQAAATNAVADLMSGNKVALHQAMIAMEEASVSFQLMVEVRNKLMEAYQELMRLQV